MNLPKEDHTNLPSPLTISKWTEKQDDLKTQIVTHDTETWQLEGEANNFMNLQLVAGLDISYPKDAHDKSSSDAFVAMVICSFPEMTVKHQEVLRVNLDQPYVPAFKELPALEKIIQKVSESRPDLKPDLYLIDGNGLLHPQKCGLACHVGIHVSTPTIGVAKNPYVMLDGDLQSKKDVQTKLNNVGDWVDIHDNQGAVLGLALKSTEGAKNPIYISIGHKISLETARKVVGKCCKHRVPEPLRFADQISRECIRNLL